MVRVTGIRVARDSRAHVHVVRVVGRGRQTQVRARDRRRARRHRRARVGLTCRTVHGRRRRGRRDVEVLRVIAPGVISITAVARAGRRCASVGVVRVSNRQRLVQATCAGHDCRARRQRRARVGCARRARHRHCGRGFSDLEGGRVAAAVMVRVAAVGRAGVCRADVDVVHIGRRQRAAQTARASVGGCARLKGRARVGLARGTVHSHRGRSLINLIARRAASGVVVIVARERPSVVRVAARVRVRRAAQVEQAAQVGRAWTFDARGCARGGVRVAVVGHAVRRDVDVRVGLGDSVVLTIATAVVIVVAAETSRRCVVARAGRRGRGRAINGRVATHVSHAQALAETAEAGHAGRRAVRLAGVGRIADAHVCRRVGLVYGKALRHARGCVVVSVAALRCGDRARACAGDVNRRARDRAVAACGEADGET